MKKSIVTMLVLPWLLCAFVAANVLSPQWQGKSTDNKQLKPADNKPEVGKYGNLLKWPGTRFHNEGYELRYEYINPRTGKKVGKLVSVFGNAPARGLLPVESDNKSSSANIKEVSVKTEDGVLTLTRLFTLNEKLEGRLIVRNDSEHQVSLRSVIFRISVGGQSVRNNSQRPVRTPLQSHYTKNPEVKPVCEYNVTKKAWCCSEDCFKLSLIGTACICPPDKPPDEINEGHILPIVSIGNVSSSGECAITFSWSVDRNRNMQSMLLPPSNKLIIDGQFSQ